MGFKESKNSIDPLPNGILEAKLRVRADQEAHDATAQPSAPHTHSHTHAHHYPHTLLHTQRLLHPIDIA